MAEPISDEALASFRRALDQPNGAATWAFQAHAILARLDAAEARAVPEGETVIDGKRWRLEGEWVDHGPSVEFLYRLVDP